MRLSGPFLHRLKVWVAPIPSSPTMPPRADGGHPSNEYRGRVGSSFVASEPVFVESDDLAWETWPGELVAERGQVAWRTLHAGRRNDAAR